MNVIGISGFQDAMAFKRAHWPNLEEREYRISQGHDSAAALVVNGTPVAAAAEERFNRRKHCGDFPVQAIHYCMAEAGLSFKDIHAIVHSFDYAPYQTVYSRDKTTAELYRQVFSREALLSLASRYIGDFPVGRIHHLSHHLAHAASAYYTSGWDDCLVIVVDGMGEIDSVSVYAGSKGRLEKIARIPAVDSIGTLYSLVTLHLGFDFNSDEYKIMGLAPYGDPARFRGFFEKNVELRPDGSIRIPILSLRSTRAGQENYSATRHYLSDDLISARRPDSEIGDDHRDVAAALQECLDKVMLHICGCFGARTGFRRLALAGGVALNCTANGRVIESGLFDDIYIQPAAGDDGSALGAALYGAAQAGEIKNIRSPAPFYGPEYGADEIEQTIDEFADRVEICRYASVDDACLAAARLIAGGKVVAWYRGRMEFGPRALGHRSILANPAHPQMRDRINMMVKMREAFRPFAPAVSLEQVHRWFDVPPMTELPYMITTVNVRDEFRSQLPAITHVNGSARVQTVSAIDNPDFHLLLKAVGQLTGREMVLNTSFNVKGQPIVNTPREAVETFLGTGIEYLFLDNILVERFRPAAALLGRNRLGDIAHASR